MSLQGEVQTIPLPDLVQWLGIMRKSGILTLRNGKGEYSIYLRGGDIADAGDSRTPAAASEQKVQTILLDVFQWRYGHFDFDEKTSLPQEVEDANLHLSANQLVLETCRLMDEQSISSKQRPPVSEKAVAVARQMTPAEELRLEILDRLLNEELQIPLLPTVVGRVMDVSRRADFSLRDLSNVIVADPLIAAQVIRQANSAYYGSPRRVDSIAGAVQRLGSQAVTNIVLSLSLQSAFNSEGRFLQKKKKLWHQGLACALLSRLTASEVEIDKEMAFLCGLMMDLGKIVLLSIINDVVREKESYESIASHALDGIIESYHSKVGGVVCKKWALPDAVLETIDCHHALESASEYLQYVAVASLSESMIRRAIEGEKDPRIELESGDPDQLKSAAMLGMTAAAIEPLITRVPDCLSYSEQFWT